MSTKQTQTHRTLCWPSGQERDDLLAREEPLEIRVDGDTLSLTMRTPGHDKDLVAGFLHSEGLVEEARDITAIEHTVTSGPGAHNTIDVLLASGLASASRLSQVRREHYASSACGVCGSATIEHLLERLEPLSTRFDPDPAVITSLPDILKSAQPTFAKTGGLHGAALVSFDGQFEVVREDVGRHNAVDKVIGHRLLQDRVPIEDCFLLVSSRIGFEIVQKALVARIPVIAALGAASSLAVELAEEGNLSLFGFVKASSYTRYT